MKIIGANQLQTTTIDSLTYTDQFPDYLSLKSEVDRMQESFLKIGYIESVLQHIEKTSDTAFVANFDLKQKYYDLYIYYKKNSIPLSILSQVSTDINDDYFVIPISQSEQALSFINTKIAEGGLPFTNFKLNTISKKDTYNLKAELTINISSRRQIDNIIIKGYEKFPKSFIKHYLKIETGDQFNLTDIKAKTKNLDQLSFASQIKSPEILFTKDSTSLYIYVEKRKSNTFDGFLGFSTNENTNKLKFDGYLNLNLNNTLNYGESFNLIYKSDQSEQQNFNVNLNLPYIFSTPIGVELELSIFKKDSTFTTTNQRGKLFYQINPKHKTLLGVESIASNNLLENNSNTDLQDYNSIYYNFGYQFHQQQKDYILFPFNFLLHTTIGIGSRTAFDTKINQTLLELNTYKIFNLDQKNSIFIRLSGKSLFSDNFLQNELFRFGGITSIRGFEENSLLASLYGVMNTEYRYQLSRTIYIHTIFDAGYLENVLTNTKEKLLGYGFGLGIFTKAGLLKLNYANGQSENQKFKLSNSKIHISLNAVF